MKLEGISGTSALAKGGASGSSNPPAPSKGGGGNPPIPPGDGGGHKSTPPGGGGGGGNPPTPPGGGGSSNKKKTKFNAAYEAAKNGGRHKGIYVDAVKKNENRLKKSIQSHLAQVELHQDKLAHPEKYDANWQNKDDREKQGLLKKMAKRPKAQSRTGRN